MRTWVDFACRESGLFYAAPCGQPTGAGRRAGPSTPRSRQIARRCAMPSSVHFLLGAGQDALPTRPDLSPLPAARTVEMSFVGGLYAGVNLSLWCGLWFGWP